MYQELYEKAKTIIKDDVCIKFYNKYEPLYLETDASGAKYGAGLLQEFEVSTRQAHDNIALYPMAFTRKCITSAEQGTAT